MTPPHRVIVSTVYAPKLGLNWIGSRLEFGSVVRGPFWADSKKRKKIYIYIYIYIFSLLFIFIPMILFSAFNFIFFTEKRVRKMWNKYFCLQFGWIFVSGNISLYFIFWPSSLLDCSGLLKWFLVVIIRFAGPLFSSCVYKNFWGQQRSWCVNLLN